MKVIGFAVGIVFAAQVMGCSLALTSEGSVKANPVYAAKLGPSDDDKKSCRDHQSSHKTWGGLAAGAGFLAGTGGVGTLALKGDGGKVAVGIISILVGAFSAVSTFEASDEAKSFADEHCSDVLHPPQGGGAPPPTMPPPPVAPPAPPPAAAPPVPSPLPAATAKPAPPVTSDK